MNFSHAAKLIDHAHKPHHEKFRKLAVSALGHRMNQEQSEVDHGRTIEVVVAPQSGFANNILVAGGQVSFNIKKFPSYAKNISLVVNVNESGGSNTITMCPLFNAFSEIQFWFNGGSKQGQSLFSETLLIELGDLSQEQLAGLAVAGGFTTAFAAATAIAASATKTLVLPLLGSFIHQAGAQGFWMGNIVDFTEARINFVNSVEAGTGTLNCQSMYLLVEYDVLTEQEIDVAKKLHSDLPHRYRYLETVIMPAADQTLAASTTYTQQLSSFKGQCAAIYPLLRANGYTNTSGGKRTFTSWGDSTTWSVLDENGKPAHSDQARLNIKLRYLDAVHQFGGRMYVDLAITPIVFGEPHSWKSGKIDKYMPLTTKEQIQYTTSSSFSGATYSNRWLALMWRYLDMEKDGNIYPSNQ